MTTTKTLKTSRQYRKRAAVPYIRLSGEWLRVAGIQPGTSIVVTVTRSGIQITPQEKTA